MSIIKIHKSEEEKLMEYRAKISDARAKAMKGIMRYQKLRDQSMQSAKMAEKNNNARDARLFASYIKRFNSTINGLNDYALILESADLYIQFGKTQKDIWRELGQVERDLTHDSLTEKEREKLHSDIDSIVSGQDNIMESWSNNIDVIGGAIEQIAGLDGDIKKNNVVNSDISRQFDSLVDGSNNGKLREK